MLIALIIKIKAKRGNFLFVPHGPVFAQKIKNEKIKIKNYIEKLKKYLIDLAKEENYSFIRIAPTLLDTKENLKIFSDLGFNKAPIYMHAERLWVLPLDGTSLQRPLQKHTELMKTDEELLALFKDNPHAESYVKTSLAKDTAHTTDESYVEMYKRLRDGTLASADNARDFINALFSAERYDLSPVGRFRFNKVFNKVY